MQIEGWRYYNHAAVPTTAPHEPINEAPLESGSVWKITSARTGRMPIMVQWITDFDCLEETKWWYVIKDEPFDLADIKAKRRYEINKGIKNFEVCCVNPVEYAEQICDVTIAAYQSYPAKYRPNVNREKHIKEILGWSREYVLLYCAFDRESDKLSGYARLERKGKYMEFCVLRVVPDCERKGINAAIVNGFLTDLNGFLSEGGYISDGARNIRHETAFQDYLEKYFGFRKAYCKMHIRYKGMLNLAIKWLYPFRRLLLKLDHISKIHLLNSLLKMEEFTAKREK